MHLWNPNENRKLKSTYIKENSRLDFILNGKKKRKLNGIVTCTLL